MEVNFLTIMGGREREGWRNGWEEEEVEVLDGLISIHA
jgi:hypothetical protein